MTNDEIEVCERRGEDSTSGAATADDGSRRVESEKKEKKGSAADYPVSSSDATQHHDLAEELLNHLANDTTAIFKSQQKGEPELTTREKRVIAEKLLERSHCSFLAKFGHHLKEEHLKYFIKDEDYETVYHVKRLQRYQNNRTRRIDVRNRRYEALKRLTEKGEYFSECETMKRNPLLYEHLVGRYLTEEERKARDSIDARNATNYADVLMEIIERDKLQRDLKSQQREEDGAREENDSDDDEEEEDKSRDDASTTAAAAETGKEESGGDTRSTTKDFNKSYHQWGGNLDATNGKDRGDETRQSSKVQGKKISKEERRLLRQEFLTNMYESFLDGKDRDFDYRYILVASIGGITKYEI